MLGVVVVGREEEEIYDVLGEREKVDDSIGGSCLVG